MRRTLRRWLAAKAFVDSGVTSLGPADPNLATVQGMAQTMATTVINSMVPQNRIQGTPPLLVGAPAFDFGRPGNPQVSVTLQRADLPTFFSRIWGRSLSTVSATAVAEAYNPGNAPAGYPPIAPRCVKPLLVANQDPKGAAGSPIVDPASGVPTATGVVGETALLRPCTGACPPVAGALQFRPAQVSRRYRESLSRHMHAAGNGLRNQHRVLRFGKSTSYSICSVGRRSHPACEC